MATVLIAQAQDAAPAASQPATPPAAAADVQTPAPEVQVADAAAPVAAKPAEATAEAKPAAEEPAAPEKSGVIPLIVIDDTPLLDAIRNLSRQAGINLIIDPKVAYGQPDPAKPGSVTPQPNVSIRWENVTAEEALGELLSNYGLMAAQNPKVKITRVTVKDPAVPDPLVTKTIQLSYSNPASVTNAITAAFADKRSKVVADARTSQVVVVATEKELVEIEKMVTKLDTKTKEVLIEAKILETTVNPKTQKGIDWTGTLSGQKIKFGNNALTGIDPTPATTDPVTGAITPGTQGTIGGVLGNPGVLWNGAQGFNPATAFLNADGLSATLSFLNSHNDSKVVSEPRMVTLDNQKASIDVGLLFPIVNTQAGTSQTAGGSQISYTNLTVSLEVTPRIAADNQIELKVAQSVLRLGPSITSTVGGQDNDVNSFFIRQVNTSVLIPSAHTLVLGGLISDENQNTSIKVPIIGDIPVFGALFRKDGKERNKNNMIIFITPTIVGDTDYQPATSTFLKTKSETAEEPEWDSWDSGKPRDWSKKGNALHGPTK